MVENCVLHPWPSRPGGPPIMIGSTSPRMLTLAAPHIDAWNLWYTLFGNTPDGFRLAKSTPTKSSPPPAATRLTSRLRSDSRPIACWSWPSRRQFLRERPADHRHRVQSPTTSGPSPLLAPNTSNSSSTRSLPSPSNSSEGPRRPRRHLTDCRGLADHQQSCLLSAERAWNHQILDRRPWARRRLPRIALYRPLASERPADLESYDVFRVLGDGWVCLRREVALRFGPSARQEKSGRLNGAWPKVSIRWGSASEELTVAELKSRAKLATCWEIRSTRWSTAPFPASYIDGPASERSVERFGQPDDVRGTIKLTVRFDELSLAEDITSMSASAVVGFRLANSLSS